MAVLQAPFSPAVASRLLLSARTTVVARPGIDQWRYECRRRTQMDGVEVRGWTGSAACASRSDCRMSSRVHLCVAARVFSAAAAACARRTAGCPPSCCLRCRATGSAPRVAGTNDALPVAKLVFPHVAPPHVATQVRISSLPLFPPPAPCGVRPTCSVSPCSSAVRCGSCCAMRPAAKRS